MYVDVKLLDKNAKLPTRGSEEAAGYDLYAAIGEPVEIQPHEAVMLSTGIAMSLPQGYFAAIYARSGMAVKRGLRPSTCVSVIDSDYRGDVYVSLYNDSDIVQRVYPGDRIAQMVIQRHETIEFLRKDSLDETKRGAAGFGSTGA